jgi:hypothetical protein
MRSLKLFEEFEKENIVRKRTPDLLRSKSLVNESKKRKKFLEEMESKIGLNNENANYFIENGYDILIELIRAKLLKEGYSSSGLGAHEAEVAYMRKIDFKEEDVKIMNDLRFYRNGILYYGKNFDAEYAGKILNFLKRIYPILIEINI